MAISYWDNTGGTLRDDLDLWDKFKYYTTGLKVPSVSDTMNETNMNWLLKTATVHWNANFKSKRREAPGIDAERVPHVSQQIHWYRALWSRYSAICLANS